MFIPKLIQKANIEQANFLSNNVKLGFNIGN